MAIKTTTINIDEQTHADFKAFCAKNKQIMGAVIGGLMKDHMERNK